MTRIHYKSLKFRISPRQAWVGHIPVAFYEPQNGINDINTGKKTRKVGAGGRTVRNEILDSREKRQLWEKELSKQDKKTYFKAR